MTVETVEINEHCIGSRWVPSDHNHLARIIAIIAMGQASHAARIIAELMPSEPAIDHDALRAAARQRLSIRGATASQRKTSRWHRDGLIFETISWIAAHQSTSGNVFLKAPHLSATTQGLDGLMIELDDVGTAILRATIFEDKCSEHPRDKFRDEIMPTFIAHHDNERASDLISAASVLIKESGLDGTAATVAAARVLDKTFRSYRGSLAVTSAHDSRTGRKSLFHGYEDLKGIEPSQRVGGTFITPTDLRPWFDKIADHAIKYIDSLKHAEV